MRTLSDDEMRRLAERLWRGVRKADGDGCWEWQRGCSGSGYGNISHYQGGGKTRNFATHRLSWELANGPIQGGLHVLHRCDNKRCVRPDHLFLGTNDDNIRDLQAKGKKGRGERGANAKLTDEQALEIRAARERGVPQHSLARTYGVSRRTIWHIQERKTYWHLA